MEFYFHLQVPDFHTGYSVHESISNNKLAVLYAALNSSDVNVRYELTFIYQALKGHPGGPICHRLHNDRLRKRGIASK